MCTWRGGKGEGRALGARCENKQAFSRQRRHGANLRFQSVDAAAINRHFALWWRFVGALHDADGARTAVARLGCCIASAGCTTASGGGDDDAGRFAERGAVCTRQRRAAQRVWHSLVHSQRAAISLADRAGAPTSPQPARRRARRFKCAREPAAAKL